jgi:hypothetical protein
MQDDEINRPEVVEEVTTALALYERALDANDTEALEQIFWNSDLVLRFGARECLIGIDDIRRFRSVRSKSGPARKTLKSVVTTFGRDTATVSMLFERENEGNRIGRWTQTWVRLPGGWRIVAAHVSLIARED